MSLTLLDWRRRVAGLYAAARRHQTPSGAGGPGGTAGTNSWRAIPIRRWTTPRGRPSAGCRWPRTTRPSASRSALEPAEPQRLEVPTAYRRRRAPGPDRHRGPRRRGTVDVWGPAATAAGSSCRSGTAAQDRGTYGGGRYLLDTVKGADLGGGRRPPGRGPELRLSPVLHLRPPLVVPAGPGGEPDRRAGRRRGAAAPRRLVRRGRPSAGERPRPVSSGPARRRS